MFLNSHITIGNFIYGKISDNFKVDIDKTAFLYGCIKPDISGAYSSIPHYMDKSFDFRGLNTDVYFSTNICTNSILMLLNQCAINSKILVA